MSELGKPLKKEEMEKAMSQSWQERTEKPPKTEWQKVPRDVSQKGGKKDGR